MKSRKRPQDHPPRLLDLLQIVPTKCFPFFCSYYYHDCSSVDCTSIVYPVVQDLFDHLRGYGLFTEHWRRLRRWMMLFSSSFIFVRDEMGFALVFVTLLHSHPFAVDWIM